MEDSNGNLWFGTNYDGLFKLSANNKVRHIEKLPSIIKNKNPWPSWNSFSSIYLFEDIQKKVRVCLSHGLFIADSSGLSSYVKYEHRVKKGRFCYKAPHFILNATANYLALSDMRDGKTLWRQSISSAKDIYTIKLLSDSLFYVATDIGAFSFNLKGEKVDSFLMGEKTSNFLLDREGNLWVSTLDNGLFLFKNRKIVDFELGTKYCLLAVEDTIFSGGIDMSLHQIHHNQIKPLTLDFKHYKNRSAQDRISKLVKDHQNQIWLGSPHYGLFLLEQTNGYLRFPMKVQKFLFHDQRILISGTNGYLLDMDTSRLYNKHFPFHMLSESIIKDSIISSIKKHGIHKGPVYDLLEIEKGKYLLGSDHGVLLYNTSTSQLKNLRQFPKGEIVAMEREESGNLWILEKTKGLFYYEKEKNQLDTIELLIEPNESFYTSLFLGKKNHLWIGSDKGLSRVIKRNGEYLISLLDRRHGLENEVINDLILVNDTIWLATSTGISALPKINFLDTIPPLLHLDSFVVDGQHYDFNTTINVQQAEISIYYTGVSYKDEGNLSYLYQLDGKQTLSYLIKERKLKLNNLPPSNYTFSITAIDSSGNQSETKTFNFKVELVWWKDPKWWTAIIILLISTVVYLFRAILQKRILEVKNRLTKDRYITVRSVMNGKKVKISTNKLLYVEASRNYKELVQANRKTLVRISMKDLMEQLREYPEFVQAHKSYIVNLRKVEGYKADSIEINNVIIPLGRTYRKQLKEKYSLIERNLPVNQ